MAQAKRRSGRKPVRNAHRSSRPDRLRVRQSNAGDFQSLQEIVMAARRNLPRELWDHLSGGADSETTLKRNRMALDSLALRQRVLVDVRKIDITTTLLGQQLASPVFLAPVGGFVGFVHPEGARNVARAAVAQFHELLHARILEAGDFFGSAHG